MRVGDELVLGDDRLAAAAVLRGQSPSSRVNTRDAARSRVAILDAAETLFAERGFDGTSLSDIGGASGLSRATPTYFFGSKERLYGAVLERVFEDRQTATARAFRAVHAWCEGDGGIDALRGALTAATHGSMTFLLDRPAFLRLLLREELDGAYRLRATSRASTALRDAFTALADTQRLQRFDVEEALLLYMALTFAPLAFEHTLLRAVDRDLRDDGVLDDHIAMAVDELMHLLAG